MENSSTGPKKGSRACNFKVLTSLENDVEGHVALEVSIQYATAEVEPLGVTVGGMADSRVIMIICGFKN